MTRLRTATERDRAPGPRGVPLLGSALALYRDQLGTYERARQRYGDVVRFQIGPPGLRQQLYGVFHPDGAEQVLTGEPATYRRDNPFYTEIATIFGNGLLTSQDEVWRRQRGIVQPLFTRQRVGGYVPVMADEADQLVARWGPSVDAGEPIDLHAEMVRFTMRIVGRILFGDDMERAAAVFDEEFPKLSDHAFRSGLSPLPSSWPTPANRRAAAARLRVVRIAEDLVRRRRREPGTDGARRDLLQLLLRAQDPETGARFDDPELRDQVLVFLVAGHETTATALTFGLHLLGRHPQVQDRVADEVQRVCGSSPPQSADVPKLAYTTRAVKEAMRLYPPAYVVGRRAPDGDEVGGHRIVPGAAVVVSSWVTHRHPDFWPQPERFDPDRFAPEAESTRHRFAYFPFGAGMRPCVGASFAFVETVVATAMVVRAFRLRAATDSVPLATAITLRPAAPVWSRPVRR